MKNLLLAGILSLVLFSCSRVDSQEIVSSFYSDKPATAWNEAIPIGNGKLGGMVFGGVECERIQTNDDTFWSGEPRDLQNPSASQYLPKIRQLLLDGKNQEAQQLINQTMLGPNNESYLPLADIVLHFSKGEYSQYKRRLNMNKGTVEVSYFQNGVYFTRKIFSSHPDNAIVIQLNASKKGSLHFDAMLESQIKNNVVALDDNTVSIRGTAPKHAYPHYVGKCEPEYEEGRGMRFDARLHVLNTDGNTVQNNGKLHVTDATEATLVFVNATSFNGFSKDPNKNGADEQAKCENCLNKLRHLTFDQLCKKHEEDFSALFNRTSLNLGRCTADTLPIDQRIRNYKAGCDSTLIALYYQFGRYLLISSSRPGTQPSNLQGIWNKDIQPAWSSNWTLNCNAEINYWPVESANLSECHMPLFDLIREGAVDGAKTAKNLYHSRGWMFHHNLDIWRTTWPVGGSGLWAIYQVGGAWLCQHIWEHYLFTQDVNFLKENYPLMKGAVEFYLDNLQMNKDGYWATNPSESFENSFIKPNGDSGWACIGPAQDMQIIRSLFKNTMAAIDILGEDEKFKSRIAEKYDNLPPMRISPTTGRLQEWNEDWQAQNPRNGQVAQGWGLVASDLITLRGTPRLAQALRKTIEYRKPGLSYNSGSWTGAFPANFWARLGEGDSVQTVIDRHFSYALSPNLTSHFSGFWEIDGNLGFTAAIGEMLLQSHAGEIELLPALPSLYPNGEVKGLRARGGYEVNIQWKNGRLVNAIIVADKVNNVQETDIRYKNDVRKVKLKKGETYSWN